VDQFRSDAVDQIQGGVDTVWSTFETWLVADPDMTASDPAKAAHAMDIVYNIADAINKIGFGLVIYSLSRSED
jgi:hypothetical protein